VGNTPPVTLDWYHLFTYVGYIFMSLLSVLAAKLWRDVEKLKDQQLTRQDFDSKVEKMELERDKRHIENSGRFERLDARHFEGALAIEKRLGELAIKIAELRPQPPQPPPGQVERRRY
jgi:hypothetical protein